MVIDVYSGFPRLTFVTSTNSTGIVYIRRRGVITGDLFKAVIVFEKTADEVTENEKEVPPSLKLKLRI